MGGVASTFIEPPLPVSPRPVNFRSWGGRVKSLQLLPKDRRGSSLTINLYFFVFSPRHYDRPKKQAAHFWGSETNSGLGVFTKNGGTVFSAVLGSIRIVNLRVAEPTQTPASGVLHTLCPASEARA